MGSVKTWSTKEEVLRDLAKASGSRIGKLDEGYIVVGDGPPPIIAEDEDFEMQLMFGEAAAEGRKSMAMGNDSPDLRGIQQMLQMVRDYTEEPEDTTATDAHQSDCVISITKVSNLNPNVKEFIPKNALRHSQNNDINGSINPNVVTQANDEKTEVSIEQDANVQVNDKSVDMNVNCVNADEYNGIATTLKNKISDAAKSDAFELKKQKNVAIATLLKLYANNKSPNNEKDRSIKLIKPDFFKSSYPVSSSTSTPEPKDITPSIPTCSSASLNSSPAQESTETNSKESITKKPKMKLDPEMKNSIEKVNKWLDVPIEQTSQPVYLNPVAFKRKEVTPSPSSSVSDTKRNETSRGRITSNESQRYKPSNYASDLAKMYMEKNLKRLEEKQKDVTWTNLEEVLKKKDLLIKTRLEATQVVQQVNEVGH